MKEKSQMSKINKIKLENNNLEIWLSKQQRKIYNKIALLLSILLTYLIVFPIILCFFNIINFQNTKTNQIRIEQMNIIYLSILIFFVIVEFMEFYSIDYKVEESNIITGVTKEVFLKTNFQKENNSEIYSRYKIKFADDNEIFLTNYDFNTRISISNDSNNYCVLSLIDFIYTKINNKSFICRFWGNNLPIVSVENINIELSKDLIIELAKKYNLKSNFIHNSDYACYEFIPQIQDLLFMNLEKQSFSQNILESEEKCNEWTIKRYKIF